MRPAAEQVVRDYLNRLSVVARSRLRPEERRLFLVRTRDYIERQSGVREMTDPADVMRVLNDYGEPETLVERERARLEARRSERERAAAASKPGFWKPRPRAGAPVRDGKTGADGESGTGPYQNLTRKDGRPVTGEIKVTSRPISSRWRPGAPLKPPKTRQGRVPPPPPSDSPPETNGAAVSGPAGPGSTGPGGAGPGSTGPGAAGPGSTGPAGAGPGGSGPGSAGPASDGSPAAPPQVVLNGVVVGSGAETGEGPAADSGAAAAADDGVPAAGTPPPAPTRRLRRPQLPRRPQFRRPQGPRRLQPGDVTRAREVARRAADAGRQHRAEAISVALLALGGLIIPIPIWVVGFLLWLIGALIAVFSSVWSLPDKWLGVIGPLALVIIGTATIVSLEGTRSTASGYLNEVLTAAMYLFKIGAVLGAGYLAWRLQRGRRSPQVPPWLRRRHI
jgi:hypothetical protein